jgi:plasmid stabilization system protein ParE
MTYRISRQADANVEGICNYIARDDPAAADRLDEKKHQTIKMLAEFPGIGHAISAGTGLLRQQLHQKKLDKYQTPAILPQTFYTGELMIHSPPHTIEPNRTQSNPPQNRIFSLITPILPPITQKKMAEQTHWQP